MTRRSPSPASATVNVRRVHVRGRYLARRRSEARLKVRVAALVFVVTMLCATPALATGGAPSSTPTQASLSALGPGWLAVVWTPDPGAAHPDRYLQLVSPSGARQTLYRIWNGLGQLVGWSGDGTQLLYEKESTNGSARFTVVDLSSGVTQGSFTAPQVDGVAFTQPDGRALYVDTGRLARYAIDGDVEARFPSSVPGLGQWTKSWLESPDGLYVVLGTARGLAFFANDGELIGKTAIPGGQFCMPDRWWTPDAVLATCISSNGNTQNLYLVPKWGAAPSLLVKNPPGSYGYTDAYQVGGQTFLQGAVPCGPPYLAQEEGSTPVRVYPPVRGNGDTVIATTSSSIAILSSGGECIGNQSYVTWYTPATNSVTQVLGPLPLGVDWDTDQVIAYPDSNAIGVTF